MPERRPQVGRCAWRFPGMGAVAALAFVAGLAAPSSADPTGKNFDPWEGIDRDGRIPKVEKPADFEHPGGAAGARARILGG